MRSSHWGSAALGLTLVGLAFAIVACGLAPVDYEGKSCTKDEECQGALVCDRADWTCRSVSPEDAGAAASEDAGRDGGAARDAGGARDAGEARDAGAVDSGRGASDAGSDAGAHDGGGSSADAGPAADGSDPDSGSGSADAGPDDGGGSKGDAGPADGGGSSQDGGAAADAGSDDGGSSDAGGEFSETCGTFQKPIGRHLSVTCNGQALAMTGPMLFGYDDSHEDFYFQFTNDVNTYALRLEIWPNYWDGETCPAAKTLPMDYWGPFDWYVIDEPGQTVLDSYGVDRKYPNDLRKGSASLPSGQMEIEFEVGPSGPEISISCTKCVLTDMHRRRCEIDGTLHEIGQDALDSRRGQARQVREAAGREMNQ
jgi:hypothetical protein